MYSFIIVLYHVTGSEVRYRRQAGAKEGRCKGKYGALAVPLYGVISPEGENVEIFNNIYMPPVLKGFSSPRVFSLRTYVCYL